MPPEPLVQVLEVDLEEGGAAVRVSVRHAGREELIDQAVHLLEREDLAAANRAPAGEAGGQALLALGQARAPVGQLVQDLAEAPLRIVIPEKRHAAQEQGLPSE